ncbi:MAG: ADOP family duplicated permease [Terriglobales bacterium]
MHRDFAYAWRQLWRAPGFTVGAVVVLALGIGVAASMYSVVNTALLRPLPYGHPARLLKLELPRNAGNLDGELMLPLVRAWQQRLHDFASLGYARGSMATLRTSSRTDFVLQQHVSQQLLSTLQIRPRLWRGFNAADFHQHALVAVLTYPLWTKDFGGRRNVLGEQIKLGDQAYGIIGVLPPQAMFPMGYDGIFTPLDPTAKDLSWKNADSEFNVIGRLRPGRTPQEAQAELSGVEASIARAHSQATEHALARNYRDELSGPVRPALAALGWATALVWLIACLSVAGLLLTRFASRRRELAVRQALGASRFELMRPLLAESVLLAAMAAALGWGFAEGGMALLQHFLQSRMPDGFNHVAVSGSALWGLAAATVVAVLIIGWIPALLAARAPAQAGLREGGNAASASRGQPRLRDLLVIGEIALALLLLAGAGLLLRTVYALRSAPLGFSTRNIVSTPLIFPPTMFAQRNFVSSFEQPLLRRVHALPGVEATALTSVIPLEQGFRMTIYIGAEDGRPALNAQFRLTSPEFPQVFGIPMVRGRFFDPAVDTPQSPKVVVVNQTFAREYFGGQPAVGQQLGHDSKVTVVGVLADVHGAAIGQPAQPLLYFSSSQLKPGGDFYQMSQFSDLAVRSRTTSASTIAALRTLLHQMAPDVAAAHFSTMQEIVTDSIGNQIFAARLLTLFALAALAIALAGLYGLLAYAVTQRRREMGIRMALGARPEQVRALVLGGAAWRIGMGIVIGLALALTIAKILSAYLYGVTARDPLTLVAAAILLALCALLAAWFPARRAAAVPPAETLRAE